MKDLNKHVYMLLFIAHDEKGHSDTQDHRKVNIICFSAYDSTLDLAVKVRFILRAIL